MNLKKCLFGGALVAAGLATHEAQAQEFDFIHSSASVDAYGYVYTHSGPGPWNLYASYYSDILWTFADASSWGGATSIGNYAWADGYTAEAGLDSRFTVTANTSATLYYYRAEILFTDLTTGTVLLSVNNTAGSQVFELLVEHEYQYITTARSPTGLEESRLTITVPAPASTVAFGLSGLLMSRRRRN